MEKPTTPKKKSLVAAIIATAQRLKKKPVQISVAKGSEIVQELSDEVSLKDLIKDGVARKIEEIRRKQVEESLKASAQIIEIIEEAHRELADLTGVEANLDDPFDWMTLEQLVVVSGRNSDYAVPNENFFVAERKFLEMLNAHGHLPDDPLVKMAKTAFKVTRSNRVKQSEILKLRRADFDVKKYPEWKEVKTLLSDCCEYFSRKMAITVSERESLKHKWAVITDK